MLSKKEILDHFLQDLDLTRFYQQDPTMIYSKTFPQTIPSLVLKTAMHNLMVWAKQAHNFLGLSDEPTIEEIIELVYQHQR